MCVATGSLERKNKSTQALQTRQNVLSQDRLSVKNENKKEGAGCPERHEMNCTLHNSMAPCADRPAIRPVPALAWHGSSLFSFHVDPWCSQKSKVWCKKQRLSFLRNYFLFIIKHVQCEKNKEKHKHKSNLKVRAFFLFIYRYRDMHPQLFFFNDHTV